MTRAFERNYFAYSDNYLCTIRDDTLENGADTSVNIYDYTLCFIPEGSTFYLPRDASLKSLINLLAAELYFF